MLKFILFLTCLSLSLSCQISSKQIGICSPKSQLKASTFCTTYIDFYVCLPEDRKTWSSYDQSFRDQNIEDIFIYNLQQKLIEEYNDPGSTNIVSNNIDCYYSYRKFLCAWNFPSCNPLTDITIPTCKSYCINFFTNCAGNTEVCDVFFENKDLGFDENC